MGLCLPIGCTPNNGGAIVRGATKSISGMCPGRQAVVSFTITFHTNRGQLFRSHGTRRQDFESKFPKISGVTLRTPFAGGDTLSQNGLGPCARCTYKHPLCPLRSYGAPLVPQQKPNPWRRHCFLLLASLVLAGGGSASASDMLVLISIGHIYT